MIDKYKKNEIKVGIVSILGIIIFIGIITFTKGISFTQKSIPVLFIFENSQGITSGSPVVVDGVKRGNVVDVWNADNRVYIRTVLTDISDFREDISAVITILELMGGKKIEVITGNSTVAYNPQKPIIGDNATDLPTVIRKVGDVTDNLVSIVIKLDTLLTKTNQIIEDKTLANELQTIINNTSSATTELNNLLQRNSKSIDLLVDNFAQISSDLNVAIKDNKPQIETIISNLETASTELNKLIEKTNPAISDANQLLAEINTIISEIKSDNGGTVSKLIYDKEFAKKLDSLVISFDELAIQIKKYGINTNVKFGRKP
jgi:phospholipid/cholesterol/gamma-HCH transport system substrate-binding protein